MTGTPTIRGENDEIVFQGGDRGSNIRHCGTSFTQPELQPDGSIQFWQLSLTVESDDFVGWGEGITYTPDTASASIVRLEPSETGWRGGVAGTAQLTEYTALNGNKPYNSMK